MPVEISDFKGDTGTGGEAGVVPAPASGDGAAGKALLAAGGFGLPIPADQSVTNPKLAQMAASTIKGRANGTGTGAPMDLTPSEAAGIVAEPLGIVANPISDGYPLMAMLDIPSAGPGDVGKVSSGEVEAPGSSVTVGTVLELVGGVGTAARYTVATAALVGQSIISGGTGWTVGEEFFVDYDIALGEAYIQPIGKVAAVSGGVVTAVDIYYQGDISAAGQLRATVNAISYGPGTGLVFGSLIYGAATVSVAAEGNYSAEPAAPVATTVVSGSGTGVTLNPTWKSGSVRQLLQLNPVQTKTTFLRLPADGVEFNTKWGPWLQVYQNNPADFVPGQNYESGTDGTFALNGFSNFTFNSQYMCRAPNNNSNNQLRGFLFDFNLNVPDPAPGSYIARIGWAGRLTGSAFINAYYGAMAVAVKDPSPASPAAEMVFLTVSARNGATGDPRFVIGQGLRTPDADGNLTLSDPGIGGLNLVRYSISDKLFAIDSNTLGVPGFEIGSQSESDWLKLRSGNAIRWVLDQTGNLLPAAGDSYDIGTSSNHIRNVYADGAIFSGIVNLGRYTVGTLPTPAYAGRVAYATDARVAGQGPGMGTGSLVSDNGSSWQIVGTNLTATA